MSRLTIQTIDSAPEQASERLLAAQKNSGFLPNLLGVLANAPTALEAYQVVSGINARNGLTAAEREVVQIPAAARHGCGFCTAGHTAIARKKLAIPEDIMNTMTDTQALSDQQHNTLDTG